MEQPEHISRSLNGTEARLLRCEVERLRHEVKDLTASVAKLRDDLRQTNGSMAHGMEV